MENRIIKLVFINGEIDLVKEELEKSIAKYRETGETRKVNTLLMALSRVTKGEKKANADRLEKF